MKRTALPLVLLLLLATPLLAADPDLVKTEVVEPGAFTAWLELSGVLVPRNPAEVKYDPEVFGGSLEVVEARGPGVVKKGEVMVRFSEEESPRIVRDAERSLAVAVLKFTRLEKDLAAKARSRELKLLQLEERSRRQDLALRRFLEELKAKKIAQAEHNLEGQQNRLKDQREELEQLEKMYKADDLTEETEEIVLSRTRRNLARSERSFEWALQRHKAFLEISLPDEEWDIKTRTRERKAELESYRGVVGIDDRVDRIAFEKATQDLERQKKRFEDLRRDVDGLRLRAPADGLAVPGRFSAGKWVDVANTRRMLEPGTKVKARQVLYTIVEPGNVRIATSVSEKDYLKVKSTQTATAVPGLLPDLKLPAVVSEVLPAGEKGRYVVLVDLKETDARLLPGSTVKVKIARYERDDALTVPAKAVRMEKGKTTVWVRKGDGFVPQDVKLGEKGDGRVEILEGLEAGAVIRAVAPKAE